jgi:hypothetical protein
VPAKPGFVSRLVIRPENLYNILEMLKLAQTSSFWGQTQLKSHKLNFEFSGSFWPHFSVQIRRHQTLIASNRCFVNKKMRLFL